MIISAVNIGMLQQFLGMLLYSLFFGTKTNIQWKGLPTCTGISYWTLIKEMGIQSKKLGKFHHNSPTKKEFGHFGQWGPDYSSRTMAEGLAKEMWINNWENSVSCPFKSSRKEVYIGIPNKNPQLRMVHRFILVFTSLHSCINSDVSRSVMRISKLSHPLAMDDATLRGFRVLWVGKMDTKQWHPRGIHAQPPKLEFKVSVPIDFK